MKTETEHGYLVLADISGYTSYLARVELEHAHEILTDLLAVIVDQFKQVLTISKLEGDAVFANVNETEMPNGERLLDLIETTYFEFRRRRDASQRNTTCTCRACQSIPSLDLKFFIHHGDYIVQNILGIRELVGSDVNLIHRLTKNHVTEATTWRAYVLLTQSAFDCIHTPIEGLHTQTETYEYLGEVETLCMDIQPRYEEMVKNQRVVIPLEETDYRLEWDFDAPPHIVWDWLTDVERRSQAMGKNGHWISITRPYGRSGVGAKNHCAHGRGLSKETILDWRPFEYVTCHSLDTGHESRMMYLLSPKDDRQTHVEMRLKLFSPKPLWLGRIFIKLMFARGKPFEHWFDTVNQLIKTSI